MDSPSNGWEHRLCREVPQNRDSRSWIPVLWLCPWPFWHQPRGVPGKYMEEVPENWMSFGPKPHYLFPWSVSSKCSNQGGAGPSFWLISPRAESESFSTQLSDILRSDIFCHETFLDTQMLFLLEDLEAFWVCIGPWLDGPPACWTEESLVLVETLTWEPLLLNTWWGPH